MSERSPGVVVLFGHSVIYQLVGNFPSMILYPASGHVLYFIGRRRRKSFRSTLILLLNIYKFPQQLYSISSLLSFVQKKICCVHQPLPDCPYASGTIFTVDPIFPLPPSSRERPQHNTGTIFSLSLLTHV